MLPISISDEKLKEGEKWGRKFSVLGLKSTQTYPTKTVKRI